MAQSTVIDQITNTTAVVTGINPTQNKTYGITLDKTSFANIEKTNLVQRKRIDNSEVPCVFILENLTPATTYTVYADYVSGASNVPESINSFDLEVKYIALGTGDNSFCVSPDGRVWIGGGKQVFSDCGTCGLWDGSKWILGGMGTNSIATSTNGIVWNCQGNSILYATLGITYNKGDNTYVAIGLGASDTVMYSSDGLTWTGAGKPLDTIFDVATNGIVYVAVGNGITISYDGIDWINVLDDSIGPQKKIVWTGTYWISFGSQTLSYSENGNVWSTISNADKLKTATWNGVDKWIAISETAILSSPNGQNWSNISPIDETGDANSIVYGDKLVLGDTTRKYGKPVLMYSLDNGQSWSRTEQDIISGVHAVIYKRELEFVQGSASVTCPIMQNTTTSNEGFMFKIPNVDFLRNLYPLKEAINFTKTQGVRSHQDQSNFIRYGIRVKSETQGITNPQYDRQIALLLNNRIVYTISNSYTTFNNKLTDNYITQYKYDQYGQQVIETYDNNQITSNSNIILEKILTDTLKSRITGLPDTSSQLATYTATKTQYDNDVKEIYYKLATGSPDSARLKDKYVFTRNGIIEYINSGVTYIPNKHKNQYTETLTYNKSDSDDVIFAATNLSGITLDNCVVSIISKNGLISYYINNNLVLIARQSIENRNKTYTSVSNFGSYQFDFGVNISDSVLSKKSYAQSLFFTELISELQKTKLFYFLFLKSTPYLSTALKQTYRNFDFTSETRRQIRLIYSCLLSVLKSNNINSVVSNGCALYSCIQQFKTQISTSIDQLQTYLFNDVTTLYNNTLLEFNNNKNTFDGLKNTIGLLISTPDIASLNNKCQTIISVITNSINSVNILNSFEMIGCLETILPLNKSLNDLFDVYRSIGDPITPATILPMLNAYQGWYNIYYIDGLSQQAKDALEDDPQLSPDTIAYLTTYSNNTSSYVSGTPLYSSFTNDLKTYFKIRYDLLSAYIPSFNDFAKTVFEPYINLVTNINSQFTELQINEFLRAFTQEYLGKHKDGFESGIQFYLDNPNYEQLLSDPNNTDNIDRYNWIKFNLDLTVDSMFDSLVMTGTEEQTIVDDIRFSVGYTDYNATIPQFVTTAVTIPKGVYTRNTLINTLRLKLQILQTRFDVQLSGRLRISLKTAIGNPVPISLTFDDIKSANALGFITLNAPYDNADLLSQNPLFMNYYKFSFFLERLSFLKRFIELYANINASLTTASNESKSRTDLFIKNVCRDSYFPYVNSRLSIADVNTNDQFVLNENNCTNGEINTKRSRYIVLKDEVLMIISGFQSITNGETIYNSIFAVSQKLAEIETINTYFVDAKSGFQKYFNTISTIRSKIDSYKQSLQRRNAMFDNYLSLTPPPLIIYSGLGSDFIKNVLPTDTRFWTKQPDTYNVIYFPEFRPKWHYYDQDMVAYNGSVYECTGLTIKNIPPTDTTFWRLEPSQDASKFPDTSAYSETFRYDHYSTVTYQNKVYSCIYEFEKDGLKEYQPGTPSVLYSKDYGFTKLREKNTELIDNTSRIDTVLNLINTKTARGCSYIATLLLNEMTPIFKNERKITPDRESICNNIEHIIRTRLLSDIFLSEEVNLINSVNYGNFYIDKKYYINDLVYIDSTEYNRVNNYPGDNASVYVYRCIDTTSAVPDFTGSYYLAGQHPLYPPPGLPYWELVEEISKLKVKLIEIYNNSIFGGGSESNSLFKEYQRYQTDSDALTKDVYGENYSISGIKANYLFMLGYQGDTSSLSLISLPNSMSQLGYPNIYESKNNSTSVKGYSPDECPFVWKDLSVSSFYDDKSKYIVGNIVYVLDTNLNITRYKCKYVPSEKGYIQNISPLANLGQTHWTIVPNSEFIRIKNDESIEFYENNKRYNYGDKVTVLLDGKTKVATYLSSYRDGQLIGISPLDNGGSQYWSFDSSGNLDYIMPQYKTNDNVYYIKNNVLELYICKADCNGTIKISNTSFWTKSETITNMNLYSSSTSYVLGDKVVFPNYTLLELQSYECINIDVPQVNGSTDCTLEYKSVISDISPLDSTEGPNGIGIWEEVNSELSLEFALVYFNYNRYIAPDYQIINLTNFQNFDGTRVFRSEIYKKYSDTTVYSLNDFVLFPKTGRGFQSNLVGINDVKNLTLKYAVDSVGISSLDNNMYGRITVYAYNGTNNPPLVTKAVRINPGDVVLDIRTSIVSRWTITNFNPTGFWDNICKIGCYKCIRAPLHFGLYLHYKGSFRESDLSYYGIGPKTDMWRSRFSLRELRYGYALQIEHPKLEVQEKFNELTSILAPNSSSDITTYTFKCPDASTILANYRTEFNNSMSDLGLSTLDYTRTINHLLTNVKVEIQRVKTIIDRYREEINFIKQDFFQSNYIQAIVNGDTDKYALINFDTMTYIDIGCGSRDTTQQPNYLTDDLINLIDYSVKNNNPGRDLKTVIDEIKFNQNLIIRYENKIRSFIDYVSYLISSNVLEKVLNTKEDGTINYDVGGVCDSIIVPLRGIDVNYSFLNTWTSRYDDSFNIRNTNTSEFGVLSTLLDSLYDNYNVNPSYMSIKVQPRSSTDLEQLGGSFAAAGLALSGLGSIVTNPNEIRKKGYQKYLNKWKNIKHQYYDNKARNGPPPILLAAGLVNIYSSYVLVSNIASIITAARELLAEEDRYNEVMNVIYTGYNRILSGTVDAISETTLVITWEEARDFQLPRKRKKIDQLNVALIPGPIPTPDPRIIIPTDGIAPGPTTVVTIADPPPTYIPPGPPPGDPPGQQIPGPTPDNDPTEIQESIDPSDLPEKRGTPATEGSAGSTRPSEIGRSSGKYVGGNRSQVVARRIDGSPIDIFAFVGGGQVTQTGPTKELVAAREHKTNPRQQSAVASTAGTSGRSGAVVDGGTTVGRVTRPPPVKPKTKAGDNLTPDISQLQAAQSKQLRNIQVVEESTGDLKRLSDQAGEQLSAIKVKQDQANASPPGPVRDQLQADADMIRGQLVQTRELHVTVRARSSRAVSAAFDGLGYGVMIYELANTNKNDLPFAIASMIAGYILSELLPITDVLSFANSYMDLVYNKGWVSDTIY